MTFTLTYYSLAFLEGFALIISPCILPILPILLSGSIEGGKKRPFGIIVGFVITFALFAVFAKTLVKYTGIDLDILRHVAFGLIILFGLVLMSDTLSDLFARLTENLQNIGNRQSSLTSSNFKNSDSITSNSTQANNNGFKSGLLLGTLVSLIWVPCGGPILAAAIVQTAVQETNWQSFLTFICFALGSIVPMILIALFGRQIMVKLDFFKKHSTKIRKIFGFIIIVGAIFAEWMGTGMVATTYENESLKLPESTSQSELKSQPDKIIKSEQSVKTSKISRNLIHGLKDPYLAPFFKGNGEWINYTPLKLEQLRGKVVLIDFWTYSCINCIRTFPYLKSWYEKYHKEGLVIIGVHTPEFEFEKNIDNVTKAVKRFELPYPVVLDNDYTIWLQFGNSYWPAHYLIDKEGKVVYIHFGEGEYDITENNIQVLLGMSDANKSVEKENKNLNINSNKILKENLENQTPETYLGYNRGNYFNNPQVLAKNKIIDFSYKSSLSKDQWSLEGKWRIESQRIVSAGEKSGVKIHFFSKKVFAVMGVIDDFNKESVKKSLKNSIMVKALLNGKPINNIEVKDNKLYEVVSMEKSGYGFLELIPEKPGLVIYTFTFGE